MRAALSDDCPRSRPSSFLHRISLATLLMFAVALSLHLPRAAALTVSEPTIVGPTGPVHHVDHGGFEGGYDWVAAQGFGEPQLDEAVWAVEALSPGDYELEAWIPNEFGDADARYQVHHDSLTSEVLVSQYEVQSGAWVKLGDYEFNDPSASVTSTDAAGDPGDRIDWSDMRWTAIASIPANVETDGTITTVREPSVSGSEAFVSRFAGVGLDEAMWVASAQGQTSPVIDTATWDTGLAAGEYAVEVYIPASHHEAEVGYTIDASDGNRDTRVAQHAYRDTWVNLGTFQFVAGSGRVTSSDNTGEPEQDIAWSALRFRWVSSVKEPEPVPQSPRPPVALDGAPGPSVVLARAGTLPVLPYTGPIGVNGPDVKRGRHLLGVSFHGLQLPWKPNVEPPRGLSIRVRCKGCHGRLLHTGRAFAPARIRGETIPVHAMLFITVTKVGWIGLWIRLEQAGSASGREYRLCLEPGNKHPSRCPEPAS